MSPLVELTGVSVRFGDVVALEGVDMEVEPGDLIVVVGPDGAGKSTLARVLVGLQAPDAGEVRSSVPKDEVGYAGADFDLYGDLTVEENLRFFAGIRGLGEERTAAAIEDLLRLTNLEEARHRLAARLSGGMKKKLSLAGALIHDPGLTVLDEPTAGVDPLSRRELWDVIAEANARGTAVVYTSPYLDEATRARRALLMYRGSLEETEPGRLVGEVDVRAWTVPSGLDRAALRAAVAKAGLGVRAYLREEGLTVLAVDEDEAVTRARAVLGPDASRPLPAELNLDDAFVLVTEARDR